MAMLRLCILQPASRDHEFCADSLTYWLEIPQHRDLLTWPSTYVDEKLHRDITAIRAVRKGKSRRAVLPEWECAHQIMPDNPPGRAPLLSLPPEILSSICSLASAEDLSVLSRTCQLLRAHAGDESHWQRIIQSNVPGCRLQAPHPAQSFRELFILHYPHWFLPRHKIWFGDEPHTGKLLIARYEPQHGVIEAFRLVAERGDDDYHSWEMDASVVIHAFQPRVQIHMDNPIVRLDPTRRKLWQRMADGSTRLQTEVSMATPSSANGIFGNFILARRVSEQQPDSIPYLWPPTTIATTQRVSSAPRDRLGPQGRPASLAQMSDTTFRLRRWMEFVHFGRPVGVRMGEDILTYSTLPPVLYTPTPRKPWRGIWVGDYAGHGCEFLLVTQPDDGPAHRDAAPHQDQTYRGSLSAIKLTGDPNVPRGECTFVADDIGPAGLIRVADEDEFRGSRVIKSQGHIAASGFRDGEHA